MKLLIGSQNKAKQDEHKKILLKLAKKYKISLQVVFPQDLGITDEPEETGSTIEENALIKAKYYFEKSGLPTIADDGSFEIDALGGLPGVQAKYWSGPTLDDSKIIAKTILELARFKTKKERTARLKICLIYYDGKSTISEIESIEGHIAFKPSKKQILGFPYRALLIVDHVEKYYDELTTSEHERFNHREKALKKLIRKMPLAV